MHERFCRIVHKEMDAAAQQELSVVGFGEHAALSECGICLDALEAVAINGCEHRLCRESVIRDA